MFEIVDKQEDFVVLDATDPNDIPICHHDEVNKQDFSDKLVIPEGVKIVFINRVTPLINECLLDNFSVYDINCAQDNCFWFIGKKQILEFTKKRFGFRGWHTAQRWIRDYSFPIRKLPNGEYFLVYAEAINWALIYDNLIRKMREGRSSKQLKSLVSNHEYNF